MNAGFIVGGVIAVLLILGVVLANYIRECLEARYSSENEQIVQDARKAREDLTDLTRRAFIAMAERAEEYRRR
jgi:hypothetical protein